MFFQLFYQQFYLPGLKLNSEWTFFGLNFTLPECADNHVCIHTLSQEFLLYVWACVLYCGNFLCAPFPWLMDTSCVLCLALSLQIYIKQCSTAFVSLHLCCTCHLGFCLAACLPATLTIRCLSKPAAHFISFFQLSFLCIFFFLILICASQPRLCVGVRMYVPTLYLNISMIAVILRHPSWVLFSLLHCDNPSYFLAPAHFDSPLSISSWVWHYFNSLSVSSRYKYVKFWHLPL